MVNTTPPTAHSNRGPRFAVDDKTRTQAVLDLIFRKATPSEPIILAQRSY
jgi:hypothetical protein